MKAPIRSNVLRKLWWLITKRSAPHDPFLSLSITVFNFAVAGTACFKSSGNFAPNE